MQRNVQLRRGRLRRPRVTTYRRSPGAGKANSRNVRGAARRVLFFCLCDDGIQRNRFRKGASRRRFPPPRKVSIAKQIRGLTAREMGSRSPGGGGNYRKGVRASERKMGKKTPFHELPISRLLSSLVTGHGFLRGTRILAAVIRKSKSQPRSAWVTDSRKSLR